MVFQCGAAPSFAREGEAANGIGKMEGVPPGGANAAKVEPGAIPRQ